MNETLEQAVVDVITRATETASKASEFLVSELPDVVQQLLWWKFAESAVYNLIGLVVYIGFAVYWYWVLTRDWKKDKWGDFGEAHMTALIAGGFASVFGLPIIGVAFFNLTWLQIWIAPKVYLIEYAAGIIK